MSLDHAEAREVRGRILKIANVNYPREVSDRIVSLTLADLKMSVSSGVLAGHFAYLCEKGYLEIEDVQSRDLPGLVVTMVRLTARGRDLLEGNIVADPGIRV